MTSAFFVALVNRTVADIAQVSGGDSTYDVPIRAAMAKIAHSSAMRCEASTAWRFSERDVSGVEAAIGSLLP